MIEPIREERLESSGGLVGPDFVQFCLFNVNGDSLAVNCDSESGVVAAAVSISRTQAGLLASLPEEAEQSTLRLAD